MDKQWLEENYVQGGMTFAELSSRIGGRSKAYRLLKKHGVVKRKTRPKYEIDREDLRLRYCEMLMDVHDIAAQYGCSVDQVKELCSRYGFKRGSDFMKTEACRSRFSREWSQESRDALSVSKSALNDGYSRWGQDGRTYIHRKIAQELLGRRLGRNEVVHHMDEVKTNHLPSNLLVIERDTHAALHITLKRNPGMDQVAWLAKNGFKVERLGDYENQESHTLKKWLNATQRGDSVGSD